MSTEIVHSNGKAHAVTFTPDRIDALLGFAEVLVKSGLMPKAVRTKEQAAVIVLTGQELGLAPMVSLNEVRVIEGTPSISPKLMLALCIQRVPGFKHKEVEKSEKKYSLRVERPGDDPHTETFTVEHARNLKLLDKYNWKQQLETMLRWRCVSAALRFYCPDVILGLYTPEELNPDIKIDFETGGITDEPVAATVVQSIPAQAQEASKPIAKVSNLPSVAHCKTVTEFEAVVAPELKQMVNRKSEHTIFSWLDTYAKEYKRVCEPEDSEAKGSLWNLMCSAAKVDGFSKDAFRKLYYEFRNKEAA